MIERKIIDISDKQLKNKKKLLEVVFRELEPKLRQFFRARLQTSQDCEDLLQELFLRLSRIPDLEGKLGKDSGSNLCYLLSIATNLIIDHQRYATSRKLTQHDSYSKDYLTSDHSSPETIIEADQQLERMMAVLKKLKPKCRQVFVMSRFKNMSHREIAREMGFSEASVERYMAMAMVALKKGLKS